MPDEALTATARRLLGVLSRRSCWLTPTELARDGESGLYGNPGAAARSLAILYRRGLVMRRARTADGWSRWPRWEYAIVGDGKGGGGA